MLSTYTDLDAFNFYSYPWMRNTAMPTDTVLRVEGSFYYEGCVSAVEANEQFYFAVWTGLNMSLYCRDIAPALPPTLLRHHGTCI